MPPLKLPNKNIHSIIKTFEVEMIVLATVMMKSARMVSGMTMVIKIVRKREWRQVCKTALIMIRDVLNLLRCE